MWTSSSLSFMWGFGSLLGIMLMLQMFSGILLASMYDPVSLIFMIRSMENGWLIQSLHANGASLFFLLMFLHLGRGMYYSFNKKVWWVGMVIFILSMATAFMGYVLPWGQMSYWGATVITSLLSAIPYIGNALVSFFWGSFTLMDPSRFFVLHFILPFLMLFLVLLHIFLLHKSGSSNPLGVNNQFDSVQFHPLYTMKDLFGLLVMMSMYLFISIKYPFILSDPENFMPVNSSVTPLHIQPEWYFLFAYAILRSIPNKLLGVSALLASLIILFWLPTPIQFNPMAKMMFWCLIHVFIMLTWIGSMPVEWPFQTIGQILSIMYFLILWGLPHNL